MASKARKVFPVAVCEHCGKRYELRCGIGYCSKQCEEAAKRLHEPVGVVRRCSKCGGRFETADCIPCSIQAKRKVYQKLINL